MTTRITSQGRRPVLGLLIALSIPWSLACAQTLSLTPSAERLAAEPDARITRAADGALESVELTRNGVVLRSVRQGTGFNTVGIDGSGRGAVLCVWRFYAEIRAGVAICNPDDQAAIRRELDDAFSAMHTFIVENSLVPVSREALAEYVLAREADNRARLPPDQIALMCRSPRMAELIDRLSRELRGQIATLLSVPRPPVMNPCL